MRNSAGACVKTQGSLPSEAAALALLFSLVVSGQIKLRRGRRLAENRRGGKLPPVAAGGVTNLRSSRIT